MPVTKTEPRLKRTTPEEKPATPKLKEVEVLPHRYVFYEVETIPVMVNDAAGSFAFDAIERKIETLLPAETRLCTVNEAMQHAVRLMARYPGKQIRVYREDLIMEIPHDYS